MEELITPVRVPETTEPTDNWPALRDSPSLLLMVVDACVIAGISPIASNIDRGAAHHHFLWWSFLIGVSWSEIC
jgi:hypothetical protein